MKENLKNYLLHNFKLDAKLLDIAIDAFKPVSLARKAFFLREAEICNKIAFINSGAMYCVYNKQGTDRVDEFSFEGQFITDYLSFLTGMPTDKDIVCLEDCELLVIHRDLIYNLYASHPAFERMGRLIAEGLYINWHLKAKSFAMDNAETRYTNLISSRPDIIQRIPQYLIASYLNVSPETISRIRKKTST